LHRKFKKTPLKVGDLSADLKAGAIDAKGQLVALPILYSTPVLFYNKEAFTKAGITTLPKNFTEMTAAAVKLKAAGVTPFYDAAKDAWPTQFMVQSLLGDAAKSGWYQKLNSREAKFTDPTFVNAVTAYKSLIDQGLYNSDIKSGTFAAQTTALLKGDVAMVNQGSFLGPALLAEAGDAATLDSKIGYFGISPTSNLTLSLPGQTDAVVAFKTGNAKREAATKQFLSYWMGKGYKAFINDRSYISLQPKVASPSTVPKLFIQVAGGLKNSVGAIQSQAIATPDIHVYLSNMINGTMTVEEVAQAMQTQFEQLAKAQGAKGF
jgi:raffinose/stachyose/melibiose transport system substrate-binding protein